MKPKTCKACGNKFEPVKQAQAVCDWQCAITHTANLKAKRERKEKAERNAKLKTLRDWLDDAQNIVNKYIRLRDADKPCISCGTTANVQYAAGHYRSRGSASHLRFNHDNLHKQCNRHCNMALSGNQRNYRAGLIERIGLERVEALENDNTPHKWTIDEAKAVIAQHKQLIKQFSNDGTEASGQRIPSHAGTPSPYQVKDAQAERVKEKA